MELIADPRISANIQDAIAKGASGQPSPVNPSGYAVVAMRVVGVLLVSHIPYAKVPRIGLRTPKGIFNTVFILGCLFAALTIPRYYFFTALLLYITWGLVKAALLGLVDRLPGGDPLLDEDEDDASDRSEVREMDYGDLGPRPPAPLREAGPDDTQEEKA